MHFQGFRTKDWNWVRRPKKKLLKIQTNFWIGGGLGIWDRIRRFGIQVQDYISSTIIREFCRFNLRVIFQDLLTFS